MRAIAGLSVLVILSSVAAVFPPKSSTGSKDQSTRPTRQRTRQQPQCNDARNGVKYYRLNTWQAQDVLREDRYKTTYPEKLQGHCPYLREWIVPLWRTRAHTKATLLHNVKNNPRRAICYVFGRYCTQALRVAWCESRWHTTSQNGQYLGLFQMGSFARAKYGHSRDAFGQAVAAYRYFRDSGFDWGPWSCKPY